MEKIILKSFILISSILLIGCAATYKPINPPSVKYNSFAFQDGIEFSYKYDVLRERGNKKLAKKEDKKGVRLVAIKVTNNTDSVINIGKDVIFYCGQNPIVPIEPQALKRSIQQVVPGYLPYLLLTFVTLNVTTGNSAETFRIGYILGPFITIGNMVVAGSANKNLLTELNNYNLLNRDIQNGETVYGIIGIRDSGYNTISLKTRK